MRRRTRVACLGLGLGLPASVVAFLVVVGMVDAQESAAGRCPAGSLGACLFYGVLAAAGVYLVFIVGACVVASLLPLESDGGEQPPGGDPPSP